MGGFQVKGVGLLSVTDVLTSDRARFEPQVPSELRHYLADPPYAGDWYPVEDMIALLDVIRVNLLPDMNRRDAFHAFGQMTAARDVIGVREFAANDEGRADAGMFRGAIQPEIDLATKVRRGVALWQLYFDSGELVCERLSERSLNVRLVGATSPGEEICGITSGYMEAVVDGARRPADSEHSTCTHRGASECT